MRVLGENLKGRLGKNRVKRIECSYLGYSTLWSIMHMLVFMARSHKCWCRGGLWEGYQGRHKV